MSIRFPSAFGLEVVLLLTMIAAAAALPNQALAEDAEPVPTVLITGSNRGIGFETYCVPIIRGAMLDELRMMDWVPRPPGGTSWPRRIA